jgi:hypothetical protein
MPRIISFAWTTPALRARRKTCTRRDWTVAYAERFHAGDEVLAYDRNPRQGGKTIAHLRLTADPVYESVAFAPDSDYEAEGFAYFAEHPDRQAVRNGIPMSWEAFERWRAGVWCEWVIRFEIVELFDAPAERSKGQETPAQQPLAFEAVP